MFNKYYGDELKFLREMGREFSRTHPALSHYLMEEGSDPDVERLLEGFAFLTGRIRQKLDDQLPEFTHTLMEMLWPHYMKPIPSMAILEFEPKETLRGPQRVPRIKTEVESVTVKLEAADEKGTRCRFRTCYDVELLPLEVDDVILEGQRLRLRLRLLGGTKFSDLNLRRLRLYLHGERALRSTLYLWLCRYVQRITVRAVGMNQTEKDIPNAHAQIQPVGFADTEGMLPYLPTSFVGYRVVQEYFAFPNKFMFIDITGFERVADLPVEDRFEVTFYFSRRPDDSLRVGRSNVHLNCTPVVNLFPRQSDPISVEHDRTEYLIRPEGPNSHHYEVYSVDQVLGWIRGTAQQYNYRPFYAFSHDTGNGDQPGVFYRTRLHESVISEKTTETYISFVHRDESRAMPPTERAVLNLTCMNRRLPELLPVGAINIPTSSSPEFAEFKNITNVTPAIHLPLDGNLHWRLIAHQALNRLAITDENALRGVLKLYNFQRYSDVRVAEENEKRLEGILRIQSEEKIRLRFGAPVRGWLTRVEADEVNFAGEGDMYLFGCILNEFLALYTTVNTFSELIVRNARTGEIYDGWEPRIGKQKLSERPNHL